MSGPDKDAKVPSRRRFLVAAGGLAAAAGAGAGARALTGNAEQTPQTTDAASPTNAIEPFWGEHQAGIVTPQQSHTYLAAFDLHAKNRGELVALLQRWTEAAARLTRGETAAPLAEDLTQPAADSGDALGLGAARLTLTFGFGAGLFTKDGQDRYGLAASRPAALVDLPRFNGDQLVAARTGGDLSIQACADDPQIAFHAIRQLSRLAYGVAELRWTQAGFLSSPAKGTPRNLLGFKDGTQTPKKTSDPKDPKGLEAVVWSGDEGPDWMRGGSYVVVRRARMALEHWDRTEVDFQEQVIGRHKHSGAPLGGKNESDPLDLDAADKDGNPIIPENAHVRLATAASNDGAQLLRRSYSYNDGTNMTAERWPPWRQGLEYDAGLLFVGYQRDPRASFLKIFEKMSKLDALNQFVTHTGGGLFACPGGAREGEFIGQRLFKTA
jgi:deferrochelatase/peroxidase EfeB